MDENSAAHLHLKHKVTDEDSNVWDDEIVSDRLLTMFVTMTLTVSLLTLKAPIVCSDNNI